MNKQELSNCCKVSVTVDSAAEGTSCYVCNECKKACDLFNVNSIIITVHDGTSMNVGEYERLKRLDENVKKKIKHFEHPANWSINNLSTVDVILLLKSLYDENQKES